MAEQINVRNLIVDILLSVTRDGEFSHIAIRNVLDKYRYLPRQERAFLTRVSEGTLERLLELDYIINQVSKTKVNKMKPVIRAILRSGVYQLKYMDSVPASAACNEAVKLAVKRGFSGLKGFVNGVMRGVSRALEQDQIRMPEKDSDEYLSIVYSIPVWMVQRFEKQFGREQAEQIFVSYLEPAPTCIRVNTERISREELTGRLEAQNICVEPYDEPEYAVRISGYDTLEDIPEFRDGLFYVQNVSSMLVAETADPHKGDFILDVCAAPGGKSIHAAQMMAGTGMVEARDLTDYKVDYIEENRKRCHVTNMRAKVWDACEYDASMESACDIVIADLPCSGLGVIGSKADIKYHASEEKIRELATLQSQILDVVCRYVKPDGKLIYSTCTVTEEENHGNLTRFLEAHPDFTLESERQILPGYGEDGFYIARVRKCVN